MQRRYLQTIKSRILEPRKFIQVISGPRQVGKTTLITQALKEVDRPHLFISADNISGDSGVWLLSQWNQARLECRKYEDYILVVDEIQKVSNWSEVVKREWDIDTRQQTPLKVVLLGSSTLLLQKGLTESLMGRFEIIAIPHWSYSEMHDCFGYTLEQYIGFGGYPGPAEMIGDETRWKQYIRQSIVEPSITRDVLLLTRIDKPPLMHRLFDVGCSYSAQIVALTKLLGEMNERGNVTTLSSYLSLLNSAKLLGGLEKFSPDIIRQRASKPKFQVYNNALMNIQYGKRLTELTADGNLWGRFVESAVGSHLLAYYECDNFKVFYWNENSMEVDYVLQRGNEVIAIEVKSGNRSYNAGMERFVKQHKPTRLYTVGTGGIALEDFFTTDPAELF